MAQQALMSQPEGGAAFFNDFSGAVSNARKTEISCNPLPASESSRIHAMIVVIKTAADYPGLPHEVPAVALQPARDEFSRGVSRIP